jgi:hypothetical protein
MCTTRLCALLALVGPAYDIGADVYAGTGAIGLSRLVMAMSSTALASIRVG